MNTLEENFQLYGLGLLCPFDPCFIQLDWSQFSNWRPARLESASPHRRCQPGVSTPPGQTPAPGSAKPPGWEPITFWQITNMINIESLVRSNSHVLQVGQPSQWPPLCCPPGQLCWPPWAGTPSTSAPSWSSFRSLAFLGNYLVLVRFQTRWEPLTIERERLVSHLTLREPGLTSTGLSIL